MTAFRTFATGIGLLASVALAAGTAQAQQKEIKIGVIFDQTGAVRRRRLDRGLS